VYYMDTRVSFYFSGNISRTLASLRGRKLTLRIPKTSLTFFYFLFLHYEAMSITHWRGDNTREIKPHPKTDLSEDKL
jgi:hypothetical protein